MSSETEKRFDNFLQSELTLEIWQKDKPVFRSHENQIKGLIEFVRKYEKPLKNLIVFDKVAGNAAALLTAYIGAEEIYAKIGSDQAKKTLKKFKIKYHFLKTIPNILNKTGDDLCPLEKLSTGKTPKEFLERVKIFLKSS